MIGNKKEEIKICIRCGNKFLSKSPNNKICSNCKTYIRTCKRCGKIYHTISKTSRVCNKCNLNVNKEKRNPKKPSFKGYIILNEYKQLIEGIQ